MNIVNSIIQDYYVFLRQYFTTRAPSSKTDYELVEENIDKFKKVWPHFKHLPTIFDDFMTWDEAGKNIKYPYIGVFVKHGLLDKMLEKTFQYDALDKIKIEKYVAKNSDLLVAIMKEEGSDLNVEVDPVLNSVEFYKGDPKYGDSFFTKSDNHVFVKHYYNLIKNEIGE